jgi:hypothetical protein
MAKLRADPGLGAPMPLRRDAFLRGRRVVLVHGLLGDTAAALGLAVLDPARRWLAGQGARCEVPRLRTGRPVAENAAALLETLRGGDGPALVIAHSKGGLEALAALAALPEPGAACAGFLAFRSGFAGTPVADRVARWRPLLRLAGLGSAALFAGEGSEGIADCGERARKRWLAAHRAEVARLLREVPVVAQANIQRSRLSPLRGWIERRSGENDGMVPVASALLPGARHLVGRGSHMAPLRPEGEAGLKAALALMLR